MYRKIVDAFQSRNQRKYPQGLHLPNKKWALRPKRHPTRFRLIIAVACIIPFRKTIRSRLRQPKRTKPIFCPKRSILQNSRRLLKSRINHGTPTVFLHTILHHHRNFFRHSSHFHRRVHVIFGINLCSDDNRVLVPNRKTLAQTNNLTLKKAVS